MSGEVLLSFAIVADDYPFKRTLDRLRLEREVEMKEFNIQMQILGLRGLQSAGVLPVKKAFIQFNLKSMVPPALGANLNNLKTDPKMPGSDPTLNTLIEFNAPLLREKLFCPRLSCSVFDNIALCALATVVVCASRQEATCSVLWNRAFRIKPRRVRTLPGTRLSLGANPDASKATGFVIKVSLPFANFLMRSVNPNLH